MDHRDLLTDAFGRVRVSVHGVLEDADARLLHYRPEPDANSIAWLVWHLTRILDDHVAGVAEVEQLWTSGGWYERFGLSFAPEETGYGQGPGEVAAVRVEDAGLLRRYFDAAHRRAVEYVQGVSAEDLDRVVDERWDPPVTLGVRLISVIDDCLEHAGQAAYVRGLAERR